MEEKVRYCKRCQIRHLEEGQRRYCKKCEETLLQERITYVKKSKDLLLCPICTEKGKLIILGRITTDGVEVLKPDKKPVLIRTATFTLECGSCSEVIFLRNTHENTL